MIEIQNEVVDAYFTAISAAELSKSALAVQEIYKQLHEATRLRVEGGIAPGFHLTRVALDLEQARLRSDRRRSEANGSLQQLQAVAGLPSIPALPEGFPFLTVKPVDGTTLRGQRPDLLDLQAQIQMAEADAAIARASGRPELELQGRRIPWQERHDRFGLRLQLSVPLFDHGRAASETRAARAKSEAAVKSFEDGQKVAEGEVRSAETELASASEQVAKFGVLVMKAKGLVDRLRPGLTEQATTLIEVLDATRVLRDLEQSHVEAKIRLALAQARLIRVTGTVLEVKR